MVIRTLRISEYMNRYGILVEVLISRTLSLFPGGTLVKTFTYIRDGNNYGGVNSSGSSIVVPVRTMTSSGHQAPESPSSRFRQDEYTFTLPSPGGHQRYPQSTSGTYPGMRSTITVSRIPTTQVYSRDVQTGERENLSKSTGHLTSDAAYDDVIRGQGSYRSMVMTQLSPSQSSPDVPRLVNRDQSYYRQGVLEIKPNPEHYMPTSGHPAYSMQFASGDAGVGVTTKPFGQIASGIGQQRGNGLQTELSRGGSPTALNRQNLLTQGRAPPKTSSLQDPRPYQLKPTMEQSVQFRNAEVPPMMMMKHTSGSSGEAARVNQSTTSCEKEAEVDALTNLLMHNMSVAGDPDFFGEFILENTTIAAHLLFLF